MTNVAIKIGGKDYLDILQLTLRYSMESFARDFTLTFTDKFLNDLQSAGDIPFIEGDPCRISVDGEVMLDGFIDDIPVTYDDKSHSIQVTGRSWHGHMVDCSAVHQTGHWKDAKLLDLCSDIAAPFGSSVKFDAATVPPTAEARTEAFRKWAIDDEETAHDFIVRASKMRGVFPVADAGKTVFLVKGGVVSSGALLARGRTGVPGNILRGSRTGRYRERFSQYIVKSQSAGFDDWYGEDAASRGVHIATDDDITAYRPLIVVSDGQGTAKALELRANWERNVRAGRSRRLSYTVQGAQRQGDTGGVWAINELVNVNDDFLGVSGSLLVIGVSLSYAEGGTATTLELGAPEQFDVLVPVPKRPKAKKGRSFL